MNDAHHAPAQPSGGASHQNAGWHQGAPRPREAGDASPTPPKYTMRISRLTIDKLGIKLYDRVTAVLAELIANSYDADAENVTVTLPWGTFLSSEVRKSGPGDLLSEPQEARRGSSQLHREEQSALVPIELVEQSIVTPEITIVDDGHGMTSDEINVHYLSVGADRRRRTGGDKSRSKLRPVMGRKGIGKLAPFGICETVEVISAGGEQTAEGWQVSHIILQLGDMLDDTELDYHPEAGDLDGTFLPSPGTTVKLRNFFRKRVPGQEELNRQLSARFGISRADWRVLVVNTRSQDERFELGTLKIDYVEGTHIDLSDRPVKYRDSYLPVTGFVAYSKKPYKDPAMAGVRIYARGKIVAQTRDFDIQAGFTGEYKMRSYLVGEVHAEWLDEEDDLVRSDRQDIIWASDQGEALKEWGQRLIKDLGKSADKEVRKQKWAEYKDRSQIESRLESVAGSEPELRESVTEAAKLLVRDIDPEALENQEHVDQITEMALAIGPHRTLLGTLREVADTTATTIDAVMALFHRARLAEMYSLGQVAEERLSVIDKLEQLVADGTTLERPLQELIEQAPWLLAPEWTPLGMNESLKRVRTSFEAWYAKNFGKQIVTSAIDNPRREPDFVMLNDAGILWIVEIKRLQYSLTDAEYATAMNYLQALTNFLTNNPELGNQFPIRRLTFVVDHMDKLGSVSLSSLNSDQRITHQTWHGLLDLTKRAHRDFLAKVESTKQADPPTQPQPADGESPPTETLMDTIAPDPDV